MKVHKKCCATKNEGIGSHSIAFGRIHKMRLSNASGTGAILRQQQRLTYRQPWCVDEWGEERDGQQALGGPFSSSAEVFCVWLAVEMSNRQSLSEVEVNLGCIRLGTDHDDD